VQRDQPLVDKVLWTGCDMRAAVSTEHSMANLVLGATNTATKPTALVVTPASGAFTGQFRVQTNHGTAVMGQVTGNNASAIGVVGDGSGPMSTGVFGQAEYLGVFGLAMGPGKVGGEPAS